MKRKIYATRRERMTYQVIGFLAFPLVNVPLWILLGILSQLASSSSLTILLSAVPWLVNGIVIVLALLFHPEFGVGYVVFIGAAVAVVTVLSIVFVAACFVTILSASVIGENLAIGLFAVLMLGSLAALGGLAIYVFLRWLSSYKSNSH